MFFPLVSASAGMEERINVEETGRTVIRRKVDEERSIAVFEKALNTMHLGVTVTDTTGKVIFTNLAGAWMHGWDPDDLVGQDVRVFAPASLWPTLTNDRFRGVAGVRE